MSASDLNERFLRLGFLGWRRVESQSICYRSRFAKMNSANGYHVIRPWTRPISISCKWSCMHSCRDNCPSQRPGQKFKDACTVARTPPAAGQTTKRSLFCCTTERMRESITGFACECETAPPEARKNPKAEFHAEAPEGCSAVRWSE